MLLDVLFAFMMLTAVIKGIRNGLVVAVFSLVGWLLGLYAALRFSDVAADWLSGSLDLSPKWLSVIAFILVFSLVTLVVSLAAALVTKTMDVALIGWLNRMGGIIFYVVLYTLIFSVIIYFAEKVKVISGDTFSTSKVYPFVEPVIIRLKQLL